MARTKRMGRNNNNYNKGYYTNLLRLTAQGVKTGYNAYRSYTDNKRSRKTSGLGVTSQYDRKTVYQKKNMPRRKKRIWKKFVKKVNAVVDKSLATKTSVWNDGISVYNTGTAAFQGYGVMHLYGVNGSKPTTGQTFQEEEGTNDIKLMFDDNPDLQSANKNVMFTNAVLDTTFSNNGTEGVTVEVDLYEIEHKRDNGILANYWASVKYAQDQTPFIGGAGELNLSYRGVTPFDLPMVTQLGAVVKKKTKYILSQGQVATYQYRDPGNHYVKGSDVYQSGNYRKRGLTHTLVWVVKPIFYQGEKTWSCAMGCTRSYKYKIMKDNVLQDNYVIDVGS